MININIIKLILINVNVIKLIIIIEGNKILAVYWTYLGYFVHTFNFAYGRKYGLSKKWFNNKWANMCNKR